MEISNLDVRIVLENLSLEISESQIAHHLSWIKVTFLVKLKKNFQVSSSVAFFINHQPSICMNF